MKNRTLLMSAIIFLFLNTSIVVARCCSHSIKNESGKYIDTVYLYGSSNHLIREEWVIYPNQKKKFKTDQSNDGQGRSAIYEIKVKSQSGTVITSGYWQNNQNFIIHPDLTVTGQ